MIARGTQLMVLKPGSILGAAEADVKRYQRNTRDPAEGETMPMVDRGRERYAFHRRHVRKAMRKENATGADIIMAALKDLERGRDSGKPMTRELYRDEELLRAAIGDFDDRDCHQAGSPEAVAAAGA